MADKRVSQFTVVNKLSSDDIFLINQNGVTRTVGLSTIKDEIVYNSQLSLSGATNGQYPRYDASIGKWKPVDFPPINTGITTDFFTNNQLLSTTGYQKFPGGFIVQWGSFITNGSNAAGSPQIIPLPIPFPSATVFAVPVPDAAWSNSVVEAAWMDWTTPNKTTKTQLGINSNYSGVVCKYIAIGY